MVFKIKKILSDKQLRRAKWTTGFASVIVLFQFGLSYVMTDSPIRWNNKDWKSMDVEDYERGRIVYFSDNVEVCSR